MTLIHLLYLSFVGLVLLSYSSRVAGASLPSSLSRSLLSSSDKEEMAGAKTRLLRGEGDVDYRRKLMQMMEMTGVTREGDDEGSGGKGRNLRQSQRSLMEMEPPSDHVDYNYQAHPDEFVFDVRNQTSVAMGTGGTIQAGDADTTPALVGTGMSYSLFTIEAGGENLPHYHPRASEFLYLIEGELEVAFVTTAGHVIKNTMVAGQATIFPEAMIHYQRNIGQSQAQYISTLNSEVPGVASMRVWESLPTQALGQALRMSEEETKKFQTKLLPDYLNPVLVEERPTEEGYSEYDGVAGVNGASPVMGVL